MTRLVIFLSSSDWRHGLVSVTSFMLIKQEEDSLFGGKRSQYTYISARQKDEGKQGRIVFQGLYFFFSCLLHLRYSIISYQVSACWCRAQVLDKYSTVPASSSSTRCLFKLPNFLLSISIKAKNPYISHLGNITAGRWLKVYLPSEDGGKLQPWTESRVSVQWE